VLGGVSLDLTKVYKRQVPADRFHILGSCFAHLFLKLSDVLKSNWTQDLHFFTVHQKVKITVQLEDIFVNELQRIAK
jgi:hypothetical protein